MQPSQRSLYYGTPGIPARHSPRSANAAVPAQHAATLGLAGIYVLLAYEWLVSGLNKLLSADYQSGLAKQIQDATSSNPNHWYTRFLTAVVMPHTVAFAVLVQWGELAVGLGLVLGAVRWLAGHRLRHEAARWLDVIVIGALAGAALMTVNYWFMSGNTLPWLNAGNPFNEGIDIDGLLTLVSAALLITHLRLIRATRVAPAR